MKLVGDKPVSPAAFALAILSLHPEYAGGKAGTLRLEETPPARVAKDWLDEVRKLFDLSHTEVFMQSSAAPVIHGRLLVIGLGLLEPKLREQLDSVGAFSDLVKELREPLDKILTERGRALYQSSAPTPAAPKEPDLPESVPSWWDDPLLRPEDDLLGRRGFARYLAERIGEVPSDSGAYALHIFGPWGAGKSTILNFLSNELEPDRQLQVGWLKRQLRRLVLLFKLKAKSKPWLVVEFNAWRHQQIQPPWWSLMEAIFKRTKTRLNLWELARECWWRFNTGRLQYMICLAVLAWVAVLVLFPLLRSQAGDAKTLSAMGAGAESLSKILALVTTIWCGLLAVNRSLLFGSARAAQNYAELTHDPANAIKDRFQGLIEKLKPERVAILIDDLDRCQSRYVVDLLEGIQTLFRDAPVVFVVAADRHWLNACYEDVYEKLKGRIREPGKSLGALFLEKAFRFSTPMPGIPEPFKQSYWEYLLRLKRDQPATTDFAAARQAAKDQVAKAQNEGEVRQLVKASNDRSFAEQRAMREEAAVRLAAPDIQARIEHTLKPYAHQLEPNPRGMKLLVNSYSANRALAILSGVEIELHPLALWTILSSRWPELAEYLCEHPGLVTRIGKPAPAGFPPYLASLAQDAAVIQVVSGDGKQDPLTEETLKQCARMQA